MAERTPFVAYVHTTFQDDHNLYMLMEYVPGGELFAKLPVRLAVGEDVIFAGTPSPSRLDHLLNTNRSLRCCCLCGVVAAGEAAEAAAGRAGFLGLRQCLSSGTSQGKAGCFLVL